MKGSLKNMQGRPNAIFFLTCFFLAEFAREHVFKRARHIWHNTLKPDSGVFGWRAGAEWLLK
jgi:hypothetical protein